MEYETPLFFHVMAYAGEADRDVVDMVSGNPDWGSPDGVAEGLHEYADLGGDDFQYPPTEGLLALREEVGWCRRAPEEDERKRGHEQTPRQPL